MAKKILILGGTTEARLLAARLALRPEYSATVSLAGRTAAIIDHAVPVRVGGFGGAAGLARHLREEGYDALIDATHPYADMISANAARAATEAGVAFVALRRVPWQMAEGDHWAVAADTSGAISALGAAPRRVFLAIGRQEVAAFEAAPQHFYLIRSIDPVEPPLALPRAEYVVARGPFAEADERALLGEERIDAIVCRNSGGTAAHGKIAAARALGIEVVMIGRPELADAPSVTSVDEAVAWLDHAGTVAEARGV